MADILFVAGARSRARKKEFNTRIDMTPMVDLGFLLITFFVFTTSISEKQVLKLVVPVDGPDMEIAESFTLTVQIDAADSIRYFHGEYAEDKVKKSHLYRGHQNLRYLIVQKQAHLRAKHGSVDNMILVLRPTEQSTYQNLINALDEVAINEVKKYILVN